MKNRAWRPQLDRQVEFPDVQHLPGDSGKMKTSLLSAVGTWPLTPPFQLVHPHPDSRLYVVTRVDHPHPLTCPVFKGRHCLFYSPLNLCLEECWHVVGPQ